ncbi:MAG: baseplate J/gp47 family protein [Acutalibacteraceae bacterium]
MFENETQEVIMKRMIERAKDEVSVIEGSLLYNAIALMAVALEDAYDRAEEIYLNAFEDTCDREHLIRFARRKGLLPHPATKATYSVESNVGLTEGDTLTDSEHSFTVTEGGLTAKVECQSVGSSGNGLVGSLESASYIEGFESCMITAQLTFGEDEEETEAFRERYLTSLKVSAQGGNKEGYKSLTESLEGVGKAAVSTFIKNDLKWVKIHITDESLRAPDEKKVAEIQKIIDPVSGEGDGLASIGHRVKVEAAAEQSVNITAALTVSDETDAEEIKPLINSAIDKYLSGLNASFGDETIIIRRSRIEAFALEIDGVVDFEVLTINSNSGNLVLSDEQIAVRGEVSYS